EGDAAALRQRCEAEYDRLCARHIPGAVIEIMSWVVHVSGNEARPSRLEAPASRPAPGPGGSRPVFDARLGRSVEVPVFERDQLQPGAQIAGPALIVEDGTSTYVSASFDAAVDAGSALILTAKTSEVRA